jgi:Zn-dependent protease
VGIRDIIARALSFLIALTVHECFHAWVADQLGDPTAKYMGRISLNPLVHLDPLGAIMMLYTMIYGRGLGWGKPVQVNPLRLRYGPRVGMGIVSFAGPFANLFTAVIVGLPLRLRLDLPGTLPSLLLQIVLINISFAVFNLIPLPPLDGYGVLQGILGGVRGTWSYRLSQRLSALEQQGPVLLIVLVLADQYLGLGILWALLNPAFMFFSRLTLGL